MNRIACNVYLDLSNTIYLASQLGWDLLTFVSFRNYLRVFGNARYPYARERRLLSERDPSDSPQKDGELRPKHDL